MNRKLLIILFTLSLLIIAGCGSSSTSTGAVATGEIKEFDMIARQWEFQPNEIRVNKGDTVRLNIESVDVAHGFAITPFGVNSRLNPGQTTRVEFVASKTGRYTFFCSVQCGLGHRSMIGSLVVE